MMHTDLLAAINELEKLGYKFESVLGKGAFGVVVKAFQLNPSRVVAIKILDISRVKSSEMASIKRELDVMKTLNHENIVKLLDTHYFATRIYVVLEYCGAGDLFGYVQSRGFLPEELALSMFRQLLNAIDHAHQQGFVHRDIKLENLFVSYDGSLKVGDWGFARNWSKTSTINNEFPGSLLYASPEIVSGNPYYGPEIDVWSMGVTLFAIATGCMPFAGPSNQITADRIRAGCYPVPATLSRDLRDLLDKMFDPNPKTRYTIEMIKQHTWFTCRAQMVSSVKKVRSRSYVSTPHRAEQSEAPLTPSTATAPSSASLTSNSSCSSASLSLLESNPSVDKEVNAMGPAAVVSPKSSTNSSKTKKLSFFKVLWEKTKKHSATGTLF